MTEGELTLHEAAAALGVHYMTAYRYVRIGILAAHKSKGEWRVRRDDIEAFRSTPAPDPSADGTAADDVDLRRTAPWAARLEARLVAGDQRGSWGVVEAAMASGADLDDLYLAVLSPALRSIGERWASGELDVFVEHRASVIAARLIGQIGPRFARRGRTRRMVIVGTPPGERHSLPVAMVADIVRQHGWEVFDLGADVPTASFAKAAVAALGDGDDHVVVGLSVTGGGHIAELEDTIRAVRAACPSAVVVVGGAAIQGHDHALAVGAHHFAPNGRAFTAILDDLANADA